MHKMLKPLYQIWTAPPQQWHPVLVHFPIVFLCMEIVFLGFFLVRRQAEYEKWALRFLHLSVWTMIIVAVVGFHDVGLDLGRHHQIWLGIRDRWKNAFVFQSSVTVHVWLALTLFLLTTLRLVYVTWKRAQVLSGLRGFIYLITAFLGLWLLIGVGYGGGLLTHR